MLNKQVLLFVPGLILLSMLLLLGACSDNKSTKISVFPLVSPARLDGFDASTLLVTDFGSQTIHLVSKQTLAPVRNIKVLGQPTGVAYADYRGGRYFVANRSLGSVDFYDAQGVFLGRLGDQVGLFGIVNDLAINVADEFVYVLDSANGRISVYDFDGNLFAVDLSPGTLVRPSALFFGMDGLLYISDFGDPGRVDNLGNLVPFLPRVWIMDQSGLVVDSLIAGSGGSFGKYSFATPQGIYLDQDGYLYLVEARAGMVQIYDLYGPQSDKSQVAILGELGTDVGELFYPLDVFVDETNKDVFVADNSNGRISVFPGGGVIP